MLVVFVLVTDGCGTGKGNDADASDCDPCGRVLVVEAVVAVVVVVITVAVGGCGGGDEFCDFGLISVLRLFMRPPKKEVLFDLLPTVSPTTLPRSPPPPPAAAGNPLPSGDSVRSGVVCAWSHCSRTLSFFSMRSLRARSSALSVAPLCSSVPGLAHPVACAASLDVGTPLGELAVETVLAKTC